MEYVKEQSHGDSTCNVRSQITALSMDNIFKSWYETYIFSILPKFGLSWTQEVKQINDLWDAAGQLIDKNSFRESFNAECNELDLNSNLFNIEIAFEKANTEWRSEIMTDVVNRLLVFWDDNVPIGSFPASWNGREIVINSTLCKQRAYKRGNTDDRITTLKHRKTSDDHEFKCRSTKL